ncbi:molybdopterin-binding protein [Neobacillus niacini]|uniref:molybdopterin-binding protein n=1 Tax=Neobacillus niacini TaxID=86668 RepID=UPI0007ABF14B
MAEKGGKIDLNKVVMKEVKVENAVGLALAHDLTQIIPGKFKGRLFKKGHVIREEDIPKLLDIGKGHIYILDLPEENIHEDEAAQRMAKAIGGENLYVVGPSEGKMTIKSEIDGLLKINEKVIHQINSLQGIALSTLTTNRPVKKNAAVSGVRQIPLILEESIIREVESICQEHSYVVKVIPFRALKVGMVTTGSEVYEGRIQDKFGPVVKKKVEDFDSKIVEQCFAPDQTEIIESKIKYLLDQEVDLILVTGGMSVDPDDRTPLAIKNTGAEIIRYGIPMLPGSMMLISYYNDIPILGLPGCVMHDPYTSFDVFLPRILAGEKITEKDIVTLGYGGFHTC